RAGLSSTAAHQYHQLRMASRLSHPAAHHDHRAWNLAERCRQYLHQLSVGRPQWQLRERTQRREPIPSRHLRLRTATSTLVRALAAAPGLRLSRMTVGCVFLSVNHHDNGCPGLDTGVPDDRSSSAGWFQTWESANPNQMRLT